MLDIFHHAKEKLLHDLSPSRVQTKLATVHVDVVEATRIGRNLNGDNYRRYTNIPAYYDPNRHTIFLNQSKLARLENVTVFIICYHELLHGASAHLHYKTPSANVFQSGIKIEAYGKQRYHCSNRLLNEGIVQYLTVYHNQVRITDFAYAREVRLVERIAQAIGRDILLEALLAGDYVKLRDMFDAHFGSGRFDRFTRLLDKRQYDQAAALLVVPQPSQYPLPFSPAEPASFAIATAH